MRIKAVTLGIAVATLLLTAVSAAGQEAGDTRVISGVGFAFRVTAPSGWRFFDEDPQVSRRLDAYLLPVTPQPASGWAIIHVITIHRAASEAASVRAWVDADIAAVASGTAPMALGVSELPRENADPPDAIFVEFDDRMRRDYRAVGYLRQDGHMLLASLVCREKQVLQSMLPSLRELVRGLQWVPEGAGR